jgi:pyruvate carboxylase subunit B
VNYEVTLGRQTHRVQIKEVGGSVYEVAIDGEPPERVDVAKTPRTIFSLLIGNRQWEGSVDAKDDGSFDVHVGASAFDIQVIDERRKLLTGAASAPAGTRQELRAQMPGKIVKVLVAQGDVVERDQGLVIIEAMKMENELRAEVGGVIGELRVREGDTVDSGALLLVVEPPDSPDEQ